MATRINPPSTLRSATWYPQFQEINSSISLPANRRFGITKRIDGVPPSIILAKGVTNIRNQYPDVNNGAIPYDNTWATLKTSEANAHKGTAQKSFNQVLTNGQTVTEEVTGLNITTNDILAVNNFMGFRKNGQLHFVQNLSIVTSIPTNGTVRFVITNNTGGNVDLTNTNLFSDYFRSAQEIAQNIYNNNGVRKGTPTFSEFNENGIPFNKIQEIYQALFNIIKSNDNTVINAADTELYGDYFEGLNGYSTDLNFMATSNMDSLRTILSSEATARGNSLYYSTNSADFRNRIVGGYFDGIRVMYDGAGIHSQIISMERAFMALSTRKVGVFGWGSFEGVGRAMDGAKWQRLPVQGGDIIRLSRAQGSFAMTEQQAFFAMFFGNTYVMWNDNTLYNTNINCWDYAYIGGNEPWKTRWQPTGGSEVQYDANNPTHPVRDPGKQCTSPWSDSAAPNLNGAYSGMYLYNQIKNRCNTKIKYATFNYSDNTGNKTGYASGNTPVLGSKGDASVNMFGNSNYGQHNIVNQWEARKPLVYEGYGTGGTMIAILNLRAGLTESVTYNITTTNNGVQSITHVGRSLGIYTI